tara:strand:- start:8040 stop:8459 length:420 start_codon:yes stop_codon:yes gene_type:complete
MIFSIYNIVIHVTFLFLTLSVLFGTVIENNLKTLFYNKTIHVRQLLDNEAYIEDKKAINNRWWKTLYVLNALFITTSIIMTGLLSHVNKKKVLKILISNAVSSIIVIFIQLLIIGFVQFSFLSNKDFELVILDELKNKL